MVGPNKILTVSYGTFSCTLEGFDDPFSTMRGIAEYFRDLAADDRYFGAEPPTPDAEMLQRIAEKEIQRRVETRVSSEGFVLTQADDSLTGDTQIAHDAVSEPTPRFDDAADDMDTASQEGGDARPFAQPNTGSGQPSGHTETETVAEKLARIRAVVNQTSDEYEESDAVRGNEDAPIAEFVGGFEADMPETLTTDGYDDYAEGAPEAEDALQGEPQDAVSFDTNDAMGQQDAPAAWQSFDQPISDAQMGDAPQEDAPVYEQSFEDQAAPHSFDDQSYADDGYQQPVEEPSFDAQPLDDQSFEPQPVEEQSFDAPAEEWAQDAQADQPAEDWVQTDEPMGDDAAIEMGTTDDAPVADGDEVEFQADETDGSFADLIAEEARAADEEEAEAEAAEADQQENVTRILKMRLNDFKASTEAHEAFSQSYEPEEEAEDIKAILAEESRSEISTLSDEDEADLMESLATVVTADENGELTDEDAVEAEAEVVEAVTEDVPETEELVAADEAPVDEAIAEDTAEAETEGEAETEVAQERPISRPEGVKVSRLMAQADTELAESESARRRSAIAHLKAAVAATRAEYAATHPDGEAEPVEERDEAAESLRAYRDDLARAVRPRRLREGAARTARKLPPLILVSEQRVHDEAPMQLGADAMVQDDDAEPAGSENIFSEAGSFSEFAREMGASELPDLLEAAAAYYHYVEGQPHFSRPQLMNAVAAMNDAGNFSREEGLRNFGILLRRGTIRKIRRGQFEIAAETRFRPELRAGE